MKTNLTTWLKPVHTGVLLGALAVCAGGCVVHERAAYTSGPYGEYYDYYYYPETDVYFYPAGGIYYWSAGGHWRSGRRLPHTVVLRESGRQDLRLHTRHPWEEHHRH